MENLKKAIREAPQTLVTLYELLYLSAAGIVIGVLVGLVETVFGYGLKLVGQIRSYQSVSFWILLVLPFAGLFLVWMFKKAGAQSRKGINLIFEVAQGSRQRIPKRTIGLMMAATWISNLVGASVGREGVAMQLGATVSHLISRIFKRFRLDPQIFLVTGMAAGFAGIFGTPFTAVFFALEVLEAGSIMLKALAPASCAAFTAAWISGLLGISKESYSLVSVPAFDLSQIGWKLLVLGIVFGLAGSFFVIAIHFLKHFMETKVPNQYIRIFGFGALMAAAMMLVGQGRYGSGSLGMIDAAMSGGTVYPWDWICKIGFTALSLSIGFIGGEVTPMFSIGATLGYVIGPFFGLDPIFCAALGYAAVFGSGTNTWLAANMIGMEIFGYEYFPFFFVICSISYLVNNNHSIYTLQGRSKTAAR